VEVTIRSYRPEDAEPLSDVMWRSVREAALADYSVEQTMAWMPEPAGAERMHDRATDGRHVLVATRAGGDVVAYIDLEANGHIDHLYALPEAVGQGVAAALVDAVECLAIAEGLRELRVEASEAARRLFEKKGFVVLTRHDWELRGEPVHNYEMSKQVAVREVDR
jgi:putative acetyltransferase